MATNQENLKIQDIDVQTLAKTTREKIESLCIQVFSKTLTECTRDEIIAIINLDMNIQISHLTVKVGGTRQIANYTPNTYGADMSIDFMSAQKFISDTIGEDAMGGMSEIKILDKYLKLRSMLIGLVSMKFRNTEDLLRNLCREAEERDGIEPLGRYKGT